VTPSGATPALSSLVTPPGTALALGSLVTPPGAAPYLVEISILSRCFEILSASPVDLQGKPAPMTHMASDGTVS